MESTMPPIPTTTASKSPSKHLGIMIAGIIALVLIAGGIGVGYAANKGLVILPFNLFAPTAPTLSEVRNAAMNITSASITTNIRLTTQPKQQGTPIFPPLPAAPEKPPVVKTTVKPSSPKSRLPVLLQLIPPNTEIQAETTHTFNSNNVTDVQGSVKGTYKSSGLSLTFDAAYRKVNSTVFFQLNTFPIPLFDVSSLSGTWVQISDDTSEISSLMLGGSPRAQVWENIPSTSTSQSNASLTGQQEELAAQVKILQEELLAHNAFSPKSTTLTRDTTGTAVWRFDIALNPEGTQQALLAAINRLSESSGTSLVPKDFKEIIELDSFVPWLRSIAEGLRSELDVDIHTLLPVRQSFHLKYALEGVDETSGPSEYLLDISYALQNINTPVSITAPTDSITVDQAVQRIMHITDAEKKLNEQDSVVNDLRSALNTYKTQKKTYPTSLQELIGIKSYTRVVATIPVDQYTQQPFSYTRSEDGTDYALSYQIQLPAEGSRSFVEGLNTATMLYLSKEQEEKMDSDSDGITDAEERKRKTSSYSSDSDRDGYSDKAEIDSGHDPLTNSKTGKKYSF